MSRLRFRIRRLRIPTTRTFTATNWNQTAGSDVDGGGGFLFRIWQRWFYDNVSATATAVVEDDDGGVTVVGSPVALTEGGSAGSYTIALDGGAYCQCDGYGYEW